LVEESNQIKEKIEDFSLEQFIFCLSGFEKYKQPENRELYELESLFSRLDGGGFGGSNNRIFASIVESELKIGQDLKL